MSLITENSDLRTDLKTINMLNDNSQPGVHLYTTVTVLLLMYTVDANPTIITPCAVGWQLKVPYFSSSSQEESSRAEVLHNIEYKLEKRRLNHQYHE